MDIDQNVTIVFYGGRPKYLLPCPKKSHLTTSESIKLLKFEQTQSNVIIAGYSGLPFLQKMEERLWLNPGVIGIPANEEETNGGIEISHQYFEYDHKTANHLMIKNNLPEAYAEKILTGYWDNIEILPLTERQLKGIAYNFGASKEKTGHTVI
ncbi:MAG: hypothetical protein ACI815_001856 [Psychroserpens sp.]